VAAFAVYPVVPSPAQDYVVPVGPYQDIVARPPYQGGKRAQSIDVLLLIHVVLGRNTGRAQVIIQPVPGSGLVLAVRLPRRGFCSGAGLARIPGQDGGGNQQNGAYQ
jgi:hypothetical protein